MKYVFHRITIDDIESAWELIKSLKTEGAEMSFTELEHIEEVSKWVDNPAQLTYVAVTEEEPYKILAILKGLRDMSEEKSHAVFLTAATLKESRGSGLAAKLTDYSLLQMKKEGVNIARIYVYSDNKSSLAAVKKLGFVHAGTVLRHHWNKAEKCYVDDLIFHKILE